MVSVMKTSWKSGTLRLLTGLVTLGVLASAMGPASAAETHEPVELDWEHKGPFGTFDRAALQRGYQVYDEVCATCHSLDHLYYRDLTGIGFSPEEVDAIAESKMVRDGPNDEGDMFMRPGKPSDHFADPYRNDAEARLINNGSVPPDLTLMVEKRGGHENYVYSLLTGYADPPEDVSLRAGMSYNPYFSGGQIAMPPPLSEGIVEYADGTPATVDQMARDVTTFLAWAAEPNLEERKQMGFKVIVFLLILTGLLWQANKRIWKRVKTQNT